MNEMSEQDLTNYVTNIGKQAKASTASIAYATTEAKNKALRAIAEQLDCSRRALLEANQKDLDSARQHELNEAMIDRLALNDERINAMIDGLVQVAELPDPVGEITNKVQRSSGIEVGRMRVPLGVVGIIYESRPNVTIDAAALCLKSGNATVLRGGSESIHSNIAIAECLAVGLEQSGLATECVQLIKVAGREAVGAMLALDEYIDVIIPRGGKELISRVSADSNIPVIKHLHGVCHVYVDSSADLDQALAIAVNAKTQRFGVCNAMETLLVAQSVAHQFLPRFSEAMAAHAVEIRGCEQTRAIILDITTASENDWYEEYLAPIIAIKVVRDLDEALAHIATYGSQHTDAIVTRDQQKAKRFLREVDSSSVMVNASTRFADGYEYGLGAEIGISTNRLHVRGPVGLEGLTVQKYVVVGDGNIRE